MVGQVRVQSQSPTFQRYPSRLGSIETKQKRPNDQTLNSKEVLKQKLQNLRTQMNVARKNFETIDTDTKQIHEIIENIESNQKAIKQNQIVIYSKQKSIEQKKEMIEKDQGLIRIGLNVIIPKVKLLFQWSLGIQEDQKLITRNLLDVENKKIKLKQIAYDINENNKIIRENTQEMTKQAAGIQFTADVIQQKQTEMQITADVIQKNQTEMQIVIKNIIPHQKTMDQVINQVIPLNNPIAMEKENTGFWSVILDKILKVTFWMIVTVSNAYSNARSSAKQWISNYHCSGIENGIIHPVTWVMLGAMTGSALKRKVFSFFSSAELK